MTATDFGDLHEGESVDDEDVHGLDIVDDLDNVEELEPRTMRNPGMT